MRLVRLEYARFGTLNIETPLEFAAGIKQRVIATDTMIVTFLPTLLILPAERRFGACLPGDTILFRAKAVSPFLICLANFCHAGILTK